MPYVPVPKDLTAVKTKIAFGLTKRQLICFSLAGSIGVPAYFFAHSIIGNEAAVLAAMGLMLPFFLFAMVEKNGQPLEKLVIHFIRFRFLTPRVRVYRTENLYSYLTNEAKEGGLPIDE